ncbi:MAG: hypothetical protein ACTSP4_04715 [Candidatus Hodarchaeales archaeon]
MSNEPNQTVEIDAIETPDGFVPTVKGLETVANRIYSDFAPVSNLLEEISKSMTKLSTEITGINRSFTSLGENMGDFLVLLAKIEEKIKIIDSFLKKADESDKPLENVADVLSSMMETKLQEMKYQEMNLYKVQEALAKTILKLEMVTKSIPLTFDD